MSARSRRRFELALGLMFVSCLLLYLSNRSPAPETAQAAMFGRAVDSLQNYSFCQPAMDQIARIVQEESNQLSSPAANPLNSVDECIAREQRIDIARCPADFRIAITNLLASQRTLIRDARSDAQSDPGVVARAFFDVYAHRSPYDSLDRMSDRIRRDIDLFQSAAFDLIQAAAKYGVN